MLNKSKSAQGCFLKQSKYWKDKLLSEGERFSCNPRRFRGQFNELRRSLLSPNLCVTSEAWLWVWSPPLSCFLSLSGVSSLPHGANSATAATSTQLSPAKPVPCTPESCTFSLCTLCSQMAWITGSRTRSAAPEQPCPQWSTPMNEIWTREMCSSLCLTPGWGFTLLPPTPPGIQTQTPPYCTTVKLSQELSFSFLPGLSATIAERRGEEGVEWVMPFKLERGDIFWWSQCTHIQGGTEKWERNRAQLI